MNSASIKSSKNSFEMISLNSYKTNNQEQCKANYHNNINTINTHNNSNEHLKTPNCLSEEKSEFNNCQTELNKPQYINTYIHNKHSKNSNNSLEMKSEITHSEYFNTPPIQTGELKSLINMENTPQTIENEKMIINFEELALINSDQLQSICEKMITDNTLNMDEIINLNDQISPKDNDSRDNKPIANSSHQIIDKHEALNAAALRIDYYLKQGTKLLEAKEPLKAAEEFKKAAGLCFDHNKQTSSIELYEKAANIILEYVSKIAITKKNNIQIIESYVKAIQIHLHCLETILSNSLGDQNFSIESKNNTHDLSIDLNSQLNSQQQIYQIFNKAFDTTTTIMPLIIKYKIKNNYITDLASSFSLIGIICIKLGLSLAQKCFNSSIELFKIMGNTQAIDIVLNELTKIR